MTDEQNEEDWQKEVQARFMRALHELDYLGFIKHTGRRIEHVARVVFDLGDEDDQGEEEED
jgi:origin recognition complex subunit 3